jgi:hypothetical protein
MSLVGGLAEFPLPEVLLLIGARTGRLRLFDGREFVPMALDLSECHAHGLRIGETLLTAPAQIIAELSFVVETGDGMFEFAAQPIISVPSEHALAVSELVMQLVLHVDEKLAKRSAVLAPELFYVLDTPQPSVEPDAALKKFFRQSRQLLAGGVRSQDLAEYLGLEDETVRLHLYNLHQLGFVKLIETTDVEALRESILEQEISEKSNEFLIAAEASSIIRRTGKLLKLPTIK